jgi:hypothetical protein
MKFNLAEKLAFIKAIDRVILADNEIAQGEMVYLGQLMQLLDFDAGLVEEARKFNVQQSNAILEGMSEHKKHSLAIMLHEMAYADGNMDREEMRILVSIFERVGIKIEDTGPELPVFDISDVYFKSSRQLLIDRETKTEDTRHEKKAVKIEPHIEGKKGYTVSIFKTNGMLSFWGNKVDMPPLQMEVKDAGKGITLLQGYNEGGATRDHEVHSLHIYHPERKIEKIVLYNNEEKNSIEFLR